MSIKKVTYKDRHGATATVEYGDGEIKSPNDIKSVLAEVMNTMSVPKGGLDHPGEPKGPDTVPAWLTPGEFVMNAEATKMFEPQLNAMNEHGREIQRAQGGTIPEGMSEPMPVPNEDGTPKLACGGGVKHLAGGSASWITPELLDSLRLVESGGRNDAVSPAGAVGEYQWMPNSAAQPGYGVNPFDPMDPAQARQATAEYLTGMQKAHGWGPEETLQAYNMGPSAMQAYQAGERGLPDETAAYAGKVLGGVSGQTDAPAGYSDVPAMDSGIPSIDTAGAVPSDLLDPSNLPKQDVDPVLADQYKNFFLLTGKSKTADEVIADNQGRNAAEIRAGEYAARKMQQDNTTAIPGGDEIPSLDAAPGVYGTDSADKYRRKAEAARRDADILEAAGDTKSAAKARARAEEADRQAATAEQVVPGMVEQQAELEATRAAQREGLSSDPKEQAAAAVEQTKGLEEIIGKGEEEGSKIANIDPTTVGEAGGEALKNDPSLGDKIGGWFKEAFKNLVDPDRMAEAALMYLGSRALGYSHEGSLNYVAKGYAKHLGNKNAIADKATLSGKYSKDSIAKYKDSGKLSDLELLNTITATGKTERYVDKNGKSIKLREVKAADGTVAWVDSDNKQHDLMNLETQDDYTKRRTDAKAAAAGIRKGLLERYGIEKDHPNYKNVPTEAEIARDIASWARDNDVDVYTATDMLSNVGPEMVRNALEGKNAQHSIRALLNSAVEKAYVADTGLYQVSEGLDASPEAIAKTQKSLEILKGRGVGDVREVHSKWAKLVQVAQDPNNPNSKQAKQLVDQAIARSRENKENPFMTFTNYLVSGGWD